MARRLRGVGAYAIISGPTSRRSQRPRSKSPLGEANIGDSAIESVDHFCVRVSRREEGFQYLESTFIHVGREIDVQAGDDLISKMAQPVEEGGFAVSVVEPAEPGTPALGLMFPRARLGMLFLPLEFDYAQVIKDVSPNDYAHVVQERFGVAMNDPSLRHR